MRREKDDGCLKFEIDLPSLMAGHRPGHPRLETQVGRKTWMPATSAGMTGETEVDQTKTPPCGGAFL
jgi:hypothetical protein